MSTTTIQQFNFSVDLLRVILWQYNDAENIENLLTRKQTFYNTAHRDFFNNWIRDVFDLRTANDFGLSVWASDTRYSTIHRKRSKPGNISRLWFFIRWPGIVVLTVQTLQQAQANLAD